MDFCCSSGPHRLNCTQLLCAALLLSLQYNQSDKNRKPAEYPALPPPPPEYVALKK